MVVCVVCYSLAAGNCLFALFALNETEKERFRETTNSYQIDKSCMWKRFSFFKANSSFSGSLSSTRLVPFLFKWIYHLSHIQPYIIQCKTNHFLCVFVSLSVYCKMRCCVNSDSPHATKCHQCKMMHWKCIDSRRKTHQNEKWTIIDKQPNQCLAFVTKCGNEEERASKKITAEPYSVLVAHFHVYGLL